MKREEWGGGRRLLFAAAILCLEGLGGCSRSVADQRPATLVPVEVLTPVATGCVPPNMSAPPEYPDTDAALRGAPDAAGRYQLLYAGRKVRSARLNELESVVAGCPKAGVK